MSKFNNENAGYRTETLIDTTSLYKNDILIGVIFNHTGRLAFAQNDEVALSTESVEFILETMKKVKL